TKPDPAIKFNPHKLSEALRAERASLEERRDLEARLAQEAEETELARKRLAEATRSIEQLEAERTALIAEVAAAKNAAAALPAEAPDWSESEPRRYKIDALLAEAGWRLTDVRDREFPVTGMPNGATGYVDYVLWGDDGRPLGLVEAKRTTKSALTGQQQAKLYADCLEQMFGQRPVILYSNGYEHWIWDDTRYPPRSVQGFLTKDELALAI